MRWICNALGVPETHLVEMFSLRKMLGSLVFGALALSVAAGSAGAAGSDEVALGVALRGLEAGVAAADAQIDACVDACENPQLINAYQTVLALVEAKAAEFEAAGEDLPQGPDHAAAVLERLLNDESPSGLAPGKDQSLLAQTYKNLKAEQAKIKAEKPDKPDKPDRPDTPSDDD